MTRHPYRSGMDFHVLGPLRASRDGVDLEVRGAKERTLLAHLVAYAGQVVPSAALIESLGERTRRGARPRACRRTSCGSATPWSPTGTGSPDCC